MNEEDYVSCLDVAVSMLVDMPAASFMFCGRRYGDLLIFFLSKIDPYTGNTYKLTTGGVCRETVIGPGIIVPRQTVVS